MQNEETNTALLPAPASHFEPETSSPSLVPNAIKPAPFARKRPAPVEAAEIARLGAELYDQKIRCQVEPQHNGKFMSIDVDTGEYVMGVEIHSTARQLISKKPDVRLYGLRVGLGYLGRI